MKNLIALIAGIAISIASGCAPTVDPEAEKAQVKTVVDQFAQILETEDMALLSKTMAHDPDMVNFGTDATERWVGWEALKASVEQQFAAFDNTKLTVKDQVIKVHASGKVAWFSEVVDWDTAAQGQPVHISGSRLTGVLEKRNGNWVFVQFHASVPVSGQAAQY